MTTLEEVMGVLGDGIDDVVRDRLILSELIAINTQLISINANLVRIERETSIRIDKSEKRLEELETYRSLTWLLKNQPKQTVAWIVLAFLLLSLVWVSTIRQTVLHFFGSPIVF